MTIKQTSQTLNQIREVTEYLAVFLAYNEIPAAITNVTESLAFWAANLDEPQGGSMTIFYQLMLALFEDIQI